MTSQMNIPTIKLTMQQTEDTIVTALKDIVEKPNVYPDAPVESMIDTLSYFMPKGAYGEWLEELK